MRLSMVGSAAAFALAATVGIAWSVDTYATETDDQTFVTEATQSGLTEIAMSKQAQEHSATPEVKAFANQMIADHTKLNLDMKTLADKKGLKVPTQPSDLQKTTIDRLSKLSGNDFDREFVKVNVDEHKKAIALMKSEEATTHDLDFHYLAQKTIPMFEHHLAQAEKLVGKVPAATPKTP